MKEWKGKFETAEGYQAGYERALLNEFERYKKGWSKKLESLEEELNHLKSERGRNLLDLK